MPGWVSSGWGLAGLVVADGLEKQDAPGMTPRFKPLGGRDDRLLGAVAAHLAGRGTAAAT